MRCVIQRVSSARVSVDGKVVGAIKRGLLVLVAVHVDDEERQAQWMAKKIVQLRIFSDEGGKMNQSVQAVGGEVLVVSQFTLYGDCRKGNRPSFVKSAGAARGRELYELLVSEIKKQSLSVQTGSFGSEMSVELINEGPTTIIIDSSDAS